MSAARGLCPMVLTGAVSRNLPCGLQLNHIKRDLFGPVNSVETNKIFNEEIEKHQEKAIKKWGFDFRAGSPLSSNSQYIWERVSFQESTYTPEMYTLTRAAHVRPHTETNSFEDLLMDERAERENYMKMTDTDSCDELQDDVVVFKVPAMALRSSSGGHVASSSSSGNSSLKETTLTISCGKLRKRQPKITEYMKERKRLAQTPKKASPPAKRMRTNSNSSAAASSSSLFGRAGASGSGVHIGHSTHAHSISAHFSLRSLHRNN